MWHIGFKEQVLILGVTGAALAIGLARGWLESRPRPERPATEATAQAL